MVTTLNILAEPKGEIYFSLLAYTKKRCSTFSLVRRNQLLSKERALQLETRLLPFLVSTTVTDEWPGTKLYGHQANINKYHVNEDSIKLLSEVDGLYSWVAPDFPEDLVFYNSDGSPWLVSISHERDSYIQDSKSNLENLLKQIPGLKVEVTKGEGTHLGD